MKYYIISLFAFVCIGLTISKAIAFDDKTTHKDLTELAIDNSQLLNLYLESYLSINNVEEYLRDVTNNYRIKEWVQEGSYGEDQPPCRASSHFHNPLALTWKEANLTDPMWLVNLVKCNSSPFRDSYSTLIWATGYEEPTIKLDTPVNNDPEAESNGRNWDVARDFFYQALTHNNPVQREANLAQTFNTLGYVLHLLQDMAVPAHTRNDFNEGHRQNEGCPDGICDKWYKAFGNPFEAFVRDNFPAIDAATPNMNVTFTGTKTLTNFWDTDTYKPAISPPTTSQAIGLAEYSNSNFVSYSSVMKEDTDDKHYFPYPNRESIEDPDLPDRIFEFLYEEVEEDGELDKSIYIKKTGHGEQIDKFLTWRYVPLEAATFLVPYELSFMPNDTCFLEYAKLLIPRAVGYSAGLIDYFFRGTMEISPPVDYVYAVIDGSVSPQQFENIKLNVRNTSFVTDNMGNEIPEEITTGELYAVAKYRIDPEYQDNLLTYPSDSSALQNRMEDIPYSYSVSEKRNVGEGENPIWLFSDQSTEVSFTFTAAPIPAGVTDLSLQVVFKGTLGSEQNEAVAVGTVDLNEPSYIVFSNSTDQPTVNGVLGTKDDIIQDPVLNLSADLNRNGVFNEVSIDNNGLNVGEPFIDPYPLTVQFGFSQDDPAVTQVDPKLLFATNNLPAGRYSRFVMLTDADPDNGYWVTADIQRHYGAVFESDNYSINIGGVFLQENIPWDYTPLEPDYLHRGVQQNRLLGEFFCFGSPCLYLGEQRTNYVDMAPFEITPLP